MCCHRLARPHWAGFAGRVVADGESNVHTLGGPAGSVAEVTPAGVRRSPSSGISGPGSCRCPKARAARVRLRPDRRARSLTGAPAGPIIEGIVEWQRSRCWH
jgi:hypothetical protein